jgi:hypothetical protein
MDSKKRIWDCIADLSYQDIQTRNQLLLKNLGVEKRVGPEEENRKRQALSLVRNVMLNGDLTKQELIDLVNAFYDVEKDDGVVKKMNLEGLEFINGLFEPGYRG